MQLRVSFHGLLQFFFLNIVLLYMQFKCYSRLTGNICNIYCTGDGFIALSI